MPEQTLLEKAQAVHAGNPKAVFSEEKLDLCLAFFSFEITSSQVAKVVGIQTGNTYAAMAKVLYDACRLGIVRIERAK